MVADSDCRGIIVCKNLTIKSGTLKLEKLQATSDLAIEGGTIQGAGYGKIKGTFASLSPVFYAKVELEGVDDNDDDDVTDSESVSASGSESGSDTMSQASGGQQTASGTMKSPETGDSAMPEIMFMILSASIVMVGRLMVKFKV